MVGQVLGAVGGLPEIFTELEVSYYLLKRLLGVRTEGDKKGAKVAKLSKSEVLMVNIGSLSTGKLITLMSKYCIRNFGAVLNFTKRAQQKSKPTHPIICLLGGRVIAVKADLAKIGLTNPGNLFYIKYIWTDIYSIFSGE